MTTILLYKKNAENFFIFSHFFFFLSFEFTLLDIRQTFFHFLYSYHSYQRNIKNIAIFKIHIDIIDMPYDIDISTPLVSNISRVPRRRPLKHSKRL